MDVKEAERVVVAKPVASRPTCPTFRSFSELLAGAINASPPVDSPQTTVAAIRPKTVRFKPAMNRPPPPSEATPSYKNHKPDTNQSVIYKPMAKPVSKATVSLLANMGNFSTSQQIQPPRQDKPRRNSTSNLPQNNTPRAETNRTSECLKMVAHNQEEDHKTSPPSTSNGGDRPCYDGYNWRKYGQKQVKGSEYPRSYYKCTHPNCPVKKKVERSFDGMIAEIVYKGEHNHSKPRPPKRNNSSSSQGPGMVSDGMLVGQDGNNSHLLGSNHSEGRIENQNDTAGFHAKTGGSPENSCGQSGECEEGSKGSEIEEDEPRSKKRRKTQNKSNEAVGVGEEGVVEASQVVVQSSADSEILGDGFRWRKYGQKVVKGNPHPRSYYRCTNIKCSARKHVERSIDDPKAFITTYEGKHNHEMPRKTTGAMASGKDKP